MIKYIDTKAEMLKENFSVQDLDRRQRNTAISLLRGINFIYPIREIRHLTCISLLEFRYMKAIINSNYYHANIESKEIIACKVLSKYTYAKYLNDRYNYLMTKFNSEEFKDSVREIFKIETLNGRKNKILNILKNYIMSYEGKKQIDNILSDTDNNTSLYHLIIQLRDNSIDKLTEPNENKVANDDALICGKFQESEVNHLRSYVEAILIEFQMREENKFEYQFKQKENYQKALYSTFKSMQDQYLLNLSTEEKFKKELLDKIIQRFGLKVKNNLTETDVSDPNQNKKSI